MTDLIATPGQTVGPFFGYALPYTADSEVVPVGSSGSVRLTGRVLDGDGVGVPDALLEIWQADTEGNIVQRPGSLKRDGYTFTGWGRAGTDNTGRYTFTTVVPGASASGRPPFIAMTVFARGLLNRLFTRIYLPGTDPSADPLLSALPEDRRQSLIAGADERGLVFDVRLQGDLETVFLQYPGHAA